MGLAACALGLAAETAQAQGAVEVFRHPVRLTYGDPRTIAPLKASVTPMDWNRDGRVDLIVHGAWWQRTEQARDGMPIYRRMGPAPVRGRLADLNANGRDDAVYIKDGAFAWAEDATTEGERRFVDRGKLQFVLNGDLRLPKSFGIVDRSQTWRLCCLGDLDADGRVDLLTLKWTAEQVGQDDAYAPWQHCGFGVGWIDGQWIFHDSSTTFWWHRNVGSAREPRFTWPRLVTTGPLHRGLTFPARAVSGSLLDFNGDGRADLFVHVRDHSMVFLNAGRRPDGSPLFDDGRRITYGQADGIDHRKAAVPYRAADGLVHILFHGGSGVLEAVQPSRSDPFRFGPEHWVLFENPPLWLDIFSVPDVADWDGDGRLDLIVGSEAGGIWWLRNTDPRGLPRRWAAPKLLEADGKAIRLYKHLSLQGPEELLIGYSNPTVEDWDLDGDLDIVAGCHGETYYLFENTGSRTAPRLTARGPVRCGQGQPVSCAWRTRPGVGDVTGDGLPDLLGVDRERKLCFWPRSRGADGRLRLSLPEHPVDAAGQPFVICRASRGIGRSKLCVVDWDQDGRLDVISSPHLNTSKEFLFFYRNVGMVAGKLRLEFQPHRIKVEGLVPRRQPTHFRMIEPVDFNNDGQWEGISGMDRGYLHYWPKVRVEQR